MNSVRKDEKALAANVMAAIARSSLDALVTCDPDGRIVEFGPSAEALYGYSRDEVVGQMVADIVVPEELRDAHINGMKHYHATGEGPVLNKRVEVPSIKRDGSRFHAELTVVPFAIEDQTYFTAFIRDITERKQYEDELKAAKRDAERANEAKSRFVAHMSHELRSPLNAVLGAIDLILDSPLGKDQRDYAQTIRSSGHALLKLIEGILDFSRIEANQLVLREKEINLYNFIQDQVAATYAKQNMAAPDVLSVIDPALPQIVKVDGLRLRQILSNLLDNAIKFTSTGGIILRAEQISLENDTSRVRFTVEDSGPGIEASQQNEIFQEFAQTQESSRAAKDGVGLGLAIAKNLVRLMNGDMGVISEPGQGAKFWLDLPLEVVDGPEEPLEQPERGCALVLSQNKMVASAYCDQLKYFGFTPQWIAQFDDIGDEFKQAKLVVYDLDHFDSSSDWLLKLVDRDEFPKQRLLRVGHQSGVHETALKGVGAYLPKPVSHRSMYAAISGVEVPRAHLTAKSEAQREENAGLKILLVEDSETNQIIAKATLERMGHTVSLAAHGAEAIEQLQAQHFDGVLMDLRMPIMDGIEATQKIRESHAPWSDIPIVALTANAVASELERCLEAGMNSHLTKPMQRKALSEAIQTYFSGGADES